MQAMLAAVMSSALLGIDVGWQPIEEGGLEYIVQIEPETLSRLKPGDELATGIRPVLRDVRRYRIVIGKGPLPRIALPDRPASSTAPTHTAPAPAPRAAAEPQRSILVPPERSSPSLPAPLAGAPAVATAPAPIAQAPPAPNSRLAAVPRPAPVAAAPMASQPAPRVVPSFDSLPDAAVAAPAKSAPADALPKREWQPVDPAPAAAPPVAVATPPAAAPLITLPAPPTALPRAITPARDAAGPGAAPAKAPLTAPPLVDKAKTKSTPPAIDYGDRYRDVLPSSSAPPATPSTDRYRDFPSLPAAQPTTASKPLTAKKELAGPMLPSNSDSNTSVKPKAAVTPPSFDEIEGAKSAPIAKAPAARPVLRGFDEASPATPVLTAKTEQKAASPAVRELPSPSRSLLNETVSQQPAPLVTDPAVRPVSAEPPAGTAAAAPIPAATPAAPAAHEPAGRPWLALTAALFFLFASLGGNVFLGWVAHDARTRYGLLLRENRRLTPA